MEANFQKALLQEIARLFEPLAKAARSPGYRESLFAELGWNLAALPDIEQDLLQKLAVFEQAYRTLFDVIAHPPETLPELKAVFARLKPVIAAAKSLKGAFDAVKPVAPYLDDLLEELLHKLLLLYLAQRPALYKAARLLTLIETAAQFQPSEQIRNGDGEIIIAPHQPTRVRADRLGALFRDPIGVLSAYYRTDHLETVEDAGTASDLLLPAVASLLDEFGVTSVYGVAPGTEISLGSADPSLIRRMLTLTARKLLDEAGAELGASLLLLSKAEGGPALAVVPQGVASLATELPGWSLDLKAAGDAGAFIIGSEGVAFSDDGTKLGVTAKLLKTSEDEDKALRIGSATGTRLEVGQLSVSAGFAVGTGEDVELLLAADAGTATFVLCAGDGDGFLQTVLPDEIRIPFALGAEWSRSRGLRLKGGAGLELALTVKRSLGGVLDIDTLNFGMRADATDGLLFRASLSATVHIGPVAATVEQIGVEARLTPTAKGEAGALGPMDFEIGFKPPSGVGLTIAAGPVTGGGYLFFDPDNAHYAGALQLELGGKIALGAVGLLTTRMPDGGKGFSLFVLISAEFPPMQLGYGFTLNGVGGLIGVNRTANADVLRAGIRTGALGSILFPKDPAKNAAQIISNLNAAFPAAKDRVLIGPMAKLGWGTPQILSLDLGLILDVPSPVRLMLLGRLRAILPSEDKPLVRLQMDALGVLDFDKQQVSLDATLYDSKLLEFALTGDMALRAGWGSEPHFLLAVGGFNPRYRPPAAFPRLNRVALSLEKGSSLKLRLETYLALTSNTAQFGARVDLQVQAAGFTVDAYLYFDALFQFAPFAFVVDIGAMAALKYKGRNLVGVKFDMSLSGPTPWHARGKASIEILFFDVTVEFDHVFGRRETPQTPPVSHIRRLLLEALSDPRSWSAVAAGHPLVRLRDPGPGEVALLLHPLGSLSVSQRVAPLGEHISRFGNTVPADGGRYTIAVAGPDNAPLDERITVADLEDSFAPAQFREMSDSEKLSAPAFKSMQSGLILACEEVAAPYDPALDLDMDFETVVYRTRTGPPDAHLPATAFSARLLHAAAGASAAAKARGRVSSALVAAA
ncbi:DUF6603 domain-containing protein [Allosphingosinicella deserti]|uniref:DUF6603 domain-containing protein n=1 Tax=Allosphingosinicella deserti TaxID=2116704 RepID=A0A2P7QIA4_9SPHN|nr:DUF6603 domain-containing protein [Sphingomonas deserti]PSJ37670.1 hypothetical protein C7I55_21650 [Sphingomonas deserti]